MNCPKCGTHNREDTDKCTSCGASLREITPGQQAQNIPNYLIQSILVTIFCCLPLGIPAIVFASQVNTKAQAGDLDGAMVASRKAKMWCWWSFGLGIITSILYVLSTLADLQAQ
jgi:uncharacterized membrane protein YvbJ